MLELLKTKDEINIVLIFIYKFSKRIKIISDKNIWNAVNWVHVVFIIIVD